MIHLRDRFARTLRDLPQLDGEFSPVVSLGWMDQGVPLNAIPEPELRRFLADAAAMEDGTDAKLEAAYLMGTIARCVANPIVGLVLRDEWLIEADPQGIGLKSRLVHWTEDGDSGVDQVFDIGLDPHHLGFAPIVQTKAFAEGLDALFAPLCDEIHRLTGLSKAALFRLVGDSFGYAFLAHGRHSDCTEDAIALALDVFNTPGTRVRNKQLRFDYISLPEAPDIGDWLRVRGGCCRAYTRPGKPNYCTTCILRDDDSRIARYRGYLRRTRLHSQTKDT